MSSHNAFNDKLLLHMLLMLHAEGPMTAAELALATDRSTNAVKGSIKTCRTLYGRAVFRVIRWDRHPGQSGPPWAVYAPGPGRDDTRPAADPLAAGKRYRERHQAKLLVRDRVKRGVHRASPFDGLKNRVAQKSFS